MNMKLFMAIIGCKPDGRFTEQHDIFFGVGQSMKDLIPQMKAFWPEAKGKIHIDAWREVTAVDGFNIEIVEKKNAAVNSEHLFFINLGGYKPGEFEEYHYKVLAVGESLAEATKKSKQTSFFKHSGFKGANAHIDDKYGIDVDDAFRVSDVLDAGFLQQFSLRITKQELPGEDTLHIGYYRLEKLD